MNKIFIILFVLLCLWISMSLIWYYKPTSFLNINYKINSKKNISDFEGPLLIVSSHAYCHADSIIVCNESKYSKNKFNIIAGKNWKKPFEQFFRDFPLFTDYNKIDVYDNYSNETVKKSIDIIKSKKENIVFLFTKDKKSKGIYHILKETKIPLLIMKIFKKEDENLKEYEDENIRKNLRYIINREFSVNYELINDYPIEKSPEDFMEWVKNKIYKTKKLK